MNREIKFRAWNESSQKMIDWEFIRSVRNFEKLLTLDHVSVMQFTTACDIKGNEVYENDIITYTIKNDSLNLKHMAIVQWRDCAWRLGGYRLLERVKIIEIIGNIHQHPQLLK